MKAILVERVKKPYPDIYVGKFFVYLSVLKECK